MSDAIHALLVLAGACFAAMAIGGSFIFGVASVCRWMKWAPINNTVNINNYGEAEWVRGHVESPRGQT